MVLYAEGGGGRPGDTDYATGSSLTARAFALWGRLSGLVPRIAIVSGRCFAGNAALAGTADLLIATESSNLGMGGPAMIEGGGLGAFQPEEVGPIDVQESNGVVDLRVDPASPTIVDPATDFAPVDLTVTVANGDGSGGFVAATGALHGIGIAIGLVHRWKAGQALLRAAGGGVALGGGWFLWQALA